MRFHEKLPSIEMSQSYVSCTYILCLKVHPAPPSASFHSPLFSSNPLLNNSKHMSVFSISSLLRHRLPSSRARARATRTAFLISRPSNSFSEILFKKFSSSHPASFWFFEAREMKSLHIASHPPRAVGTRCESGYGT